MSERGASATVSFCVSSTTFRWLSSRSPFSPMAAYLAAAGVDRMVYLFDAKSWKLARKLSGQPEMISALAFSPDSRLLLSGGFSELTSRHPVKILLWDVVTGKLLRSLVFGPESRYGRLLARWCTCCSLVPTEVRKHLVQGKGGSWQPLSDSTNLPGCAHSIKASGNNFRTLSSFDPEQRSAPCAALQI